MIQRLLGMTVALVLDDVLFHTTDAFAVGLRAQTMGGRIGALSVAVIVMVAAMVGARMWFPRSFFHGFTVAMGMFLSIDIILIHWIFQLHRITSGPEANVIEPIFVAIGLAFLAFGIRGERATSV